MAPGCAADGRDKPVPSLAKRRARPRMPSGMPRRARAACSSWLSSGVGDDVTRRRSENRRALQVPQLRLVEIAERLVHRAPVVPYDDVVRTPLMPIDELGPRRPADEEIDEGFALGVGHAFEALDLLADVQRLAARFRMHAHDRLCDRRIDFLLLV